MADWDNSYYTSDKEYEATQLEVFYKLYEKVCFMLFSNKVDPCNNIWSYYTLHFYFAVHLF